MLGIFAIGISFVIITGGIDLSIGSIIGLTGVLIAKLSGQHDPENPAAGGMGWSLWIGVPGRALAVASLVGLAQGLLITRLNLQPFIVTLGGMLLLRGVSQTIVGGGTLSLGDVPLANLANGGVLGAAGNPLRAVPGRDPVRWWRWSPRTCCTSPCSAATSTRSAATARRRSTPASRSSRVETLTYVISALTAGIAGVCYAAYIGQMSQQVGIAYELYAIAAAVLGGVSLRGGEGTVIGAIIGSCIMRVIDNGINMFQWVYRDAAGVRRIVPPGQQLDVHHHRGGHPGRGDPGPGGAPAPVEAAHQSGRPPRVTAPPERRRLDDLRG